MKKTIWEKRIPTFLGILLIVIGTAATTYLVKNGAIFSGRAAPSYTPENIRLTNVSDTSFTVSYTTKESAIGSVSYGKDSSLGTTSFDDRDQQTNNVSSYKIHYFTIRNLRPSTKYFFSITSAQTTFLNDSNPFEITTAPSINTTPPLQKPIAGKVISPDGKPIDEAIVYLTSDNAQTISALIKSDGSYILPLNSIRSQGLISYVSFSDNSSIKILIIGPLQKSNVTISSKQINPVPIITLSNDYNFTVNDSPLASNSAEAIGFPSFSANPSSKNPQILTPKKDEEFSDQQPLLKGIASPGASVKIIIHSSEQIDTQVTADARGNWIYRPTQQLSPGEHTVSITTRDQSGILKTITQSFTVYAAGTTVNQTATPSATPTITTSPAPSNTPSPTAILRPTLAPTLQPTLTPTLTPTPSPTVTIQPAIKGSTNLPPPGNSSIMIAGIAGIATIITGILLFLLTRGGVSAL